MKLAELELKKKIKTVETIPTKKRNKHQLPEMTVSKTRRRHVNALPLQLYIHKSLV